MRIKVKKTSLEALKEKGFKKSTKPIKPLWILSALIYIISSFELWFKGFKFSRENMDKAEGPCLILMNHSAFIDLKIAFKCFFPKRFAIVCTTDALIGKAALMKLLGCISTNKFVTDVGLISNMLYSLQKNKTSVLMYPEAGYSFDGCATALPPRLGVLVKKAGVPVVSVITDGAFLHQPLYNELRTRKVKISANVKCLLTAEEIKEKSAEEITEILNAEFAFDGFKNQQERRIAVTENTRAQGLERILYRCPDCHSENTLESKESKIFCKHCKKEWELDIYGSLKALKGETEFSHIPDWYNWERECVRSEIQNGNYKMETDVEIGVICDNKALYMVGDGHLTHTADGFSLTDAKGDLIYTHSPLSSYSLNSDYYWYEIGDVISIGDRKILYYCFPKTNISVTKARLAAEEIYKLKKKGLL